MKWRMHLSDFPCVLFLHLPEHLLSVLGELPRVRVPLLVVLHLARQTAFTRNETENGCRREQMQCWRWLSKSDCLPPAATSLSSFSLVNSVNELLSMNTFWSLFHQIANTLENVKHLYIYEIDRWINKARKLSLLINLVTNLINS